MDVHEGRRPRQSEWRTTADCTIRGFCGPFEHVERALPGSESDAVFARCALCGEWVDLRIHAPRFALASFHGLAHGTLHA